MAGPRRRTSSAAGEQKPAGRWDRFLFRIMGPPDVGDLSAPPRELPVRVDICQTCGQARETHEVVRTGRLTYTQCPGRR